MLADDRAAAKYVLARNLMLGARLAALLVAAVSGFLLVRSLVRQLCAEPAEVVVADDRSTSGDWYRGAVRFGDASSILFSVKRVHDSLADIVGNVRAGTETIATVVSQIAAGNRTCRHVPKSRQVRSRKPHRRWKK